MTVSKVEYASGGGSITATPTVTVATTPAAGDYAVFVCASLGSTLESVSGLGATWGTPVGIVDPGSGTSAWFCLGTGATASGVVTGTMSAGARVTRGVFIVRGVTAGASLTFDSAAATSGTGIDGPTQTATLGDFVIGMMGVNSSVMTWPSAQTPSGAFTAETAQTSSTALRSQVGSAIPVGSASYSTSGTSNNGLVKRISQVVLGVPAAVTPDGEAAGAFAWSGLAMGAKVVAGVAVGALAWTGVAAGTSTRNGSAAGAMSWAGSAAGEAPLAGAPGEGAGVGGFAWTGAALGASVLAGSAAGAFAWAGTAVGESPSAGVTGGSAAGTFEWAGTGDGDNGNALPGSFGWVGSNDSVAVIGYVEHPAAVAPANIVERVLTRVSHQMPAISPDADGLYRTDGTHPVVEESLGVLHVFVGGVDVTYLRGVPTLIGSMRSSQPAGDETVSLTFPQVHPFDTRTGDLAPLQPDAPCEIALLRGDGSRLVLFAGHLVSDNVDQGPNSNSETWHVEGTLMQADHGMHSPVAYLPSRDIGILVRDNLRGVMGRRYPRIPVAYTGILSRKRGAYGDTKLDYVSDLLATAWTADDRQWTITRTDIPRRYELALKDTTTVHHVVTAGAPGINCNLTEDHAERIDAIYGRGVGPDGYSWANWHFPGFHDYDPPDYPYPSASTMMTVGSTGAGVTLWQDRMAELGYQIAVDGSFGTADAAVARAFQAVRGAKVDGVVGPQTWNESWNLGTHNLTLPRRMPIAARPETDPGLYDDSGTFVGMNPTFDPTVIRHEIDIDYGAGVTKAEAILSAERQLARDSVVGWAGTITLETCPWYTSRWEIFEGQNIQLLGWRGQDILMHVVEVTKDPMGGAVTVTVDSKARDAMTLSSILKRDRESRPDPGRRPGAVNRRSRQEQDMAVEFDGESPAGRIPRIALFRNLWTVWTIPLSQVGTLVKTLATTDTPAAEFSMGLFGKPISSNTLASLVGNPLSADDAWTRNEDTLFDSYGYITSWGNASEAAGTHPDKGLTGVLEDTGGVEFVSQRPPWVWVALYSETSCFVSGRLLPGPVT